MANKQKSNGKHPSTAASNDSLMPYEKAVAEGKAIIETMDRDQRRHQLRLGELADMVETKYADQSVSKFANEIGLPNCGTLRRYLSVYRAWKGIQAPGPVSYAVLRELQNHPDREAIVNANPKITKREAQTLRQEQEGKQQHKGKKKRGKPGDWEANGNKRWLRDLCSVNNKHGRTAQEVMRNKEKVHALQEISDPALLTALVSDLEVQLALARLLLHKDTEKAERKTPRLKEAEGLAA